MQPASRSLSWLPFPGTCVRHRAAIIQQHRQMCQAKNTGQQPRYLITLKMPNSRKIPIESSAFVACLKTSRAAARRDYGSLILRGRPSVGWFAAGFAGVVVFCVFGLLSTGITVGLTLLVPPAGAFVLAFASVASRVFSVASAASFSAFSSIAFSSA